MRAARLGLLALLALASGCFDSVVGHPCAAGYTMCGDRCVDLSRTQDNCGACGVVCDQSCRAGACVPDDGGPPDVTGSGGFSGSGGVPGSGGFSGSGGVPGSGGFSGSGGVPGSGGAPGTGGVIDGGAGGAVATGGAPGTGGAGGVAGTGGAGGTGGTGGSDAPVDVPQLDAAADLDPDLDAEPEAPDAPEVTDVDLDVPEVSCDGGMTACGQRCVVLADDPDNCGGCGVLCGSGLCMGGICQQQNTGHAVVIGHDYTVTRTGMNNLLGNAIFLGVGDPTKVLVYLDHAAPAAVLGTQAAINQVAQQRGRRWVLTPGSATMVENDLDGYDVLLILAQPNASDSTLVDRGNAWSSALSRFLSNDRTIVLLDGASGSNGGTFQILRAAGLLAASGRTDVTGDTLTLFNPSDAVALRVPRTYRAELSSVSFTSPETARVVTTAGGAPVVIHKTF